MSSQAQDSAFLITDRLPVQVEQRLDDLHAEVAEGIVVRSGVAERDCHS